MSDLIKTLHPQNNIEDNVYPNIIADNIPDSSISSSKLDSTLLTTINNKANSSDISDKKITITQNGVTKGSFTLNQTSNSVIALDSGTDETILIIQQTELTLTIEKTNFCQYEIPEEYSDYIIKMFQDSTDTPYYIKLNQTYDGQSLGICQSTITLSLKKITTYLYNTNTLELSNCYLVALFGDVDLTNYETKTYNFFTIKFDSGKNLFYLYTPFKILNEYSENTITILKKNIY